MKACPPPDRKKALTLVELLTSRAADLDTERGYTFFCGDDQEDTWLRYGELHSDALKIAGVLRSHVAQLPGPLTPPPRVVLLCPPGPAYLRAFFGVLYAGLTAVTAYPPRARRRDQRLERVVHKSGAAIALVDHDLFSHRELFCRVSPQLRNLRWVDVDAINEHSPRLELPIEVEPDSLAMLQYTSGSTSAPKGVCLSHRNLMANLEMIYQAFDFDSYPDAWSVTWLPPFHDMGLIGGLLESLYAGRSTHVLPPASFIQKPIRWLRAIAKYQASISGGPNFAYDLCVDKTSAEERRDLDLRCWTLAFTGAEPIRLATLERFANAFSSSGFSRSSFYPCYGLAEATLLISGGPRSRDPRTAPLPDWPSARIDGSVPQVVSCGRVAAGQTVAIVDPKSLEPCREGTVGEIWIAGDHVSGGYWQEPELTAALFARHLPNNSAAFLRTGDLGFLQDGELYVTGRCKELIILRGRNFHPTDIEAIVSAADPRCVSHGAAVFECNDDRTSHLGIVQEAELSSESEGAEIAGRIREAVFEAFELEPHSIVLIRKRTLPKTSSGKIMRLETKDRFEHGQLEILWSSRDRFPGQEDRPAEASCENPPSIGCSAPNRSQIVSWLRERIAQHAQQGAAEIDVARPLSQFGLDSVTAVQMAGELEAFVGEKIPATLFLDAPTITAVALRLRPAAGDCDLGTDLKQANGTPQRKKSPVETVAAGDLSSARQMAVVGAACRLPGCENLDDFWNLLVGGKSAIGFPDPARVADLGPFLARCQAGWLRDVDLFDAELFGISPREAASIDPQHRLLLETCWRAIEDAHLDPQRLSGTRTGVFVGMSSSDYERCIVAQKPLLDVYDMTGNAASMGAHRVSYHLNLTGPSLTIDTACSSSLVALHQAIRSLQAGDCEMAIVAGVNLILSPEVFLTLRDAHMLSPRDTCSPFDASADGYVRGEGCVALLLGRVPDVSSRGWRSRGIIVGSAINQDGTTSGITVPNRDAQIRLYRQALADAQIDPVTLHWFESHGTGTPLGDPIEVASLQKVYGARVPGDDTPCLLSGVKANIGHLEGAAGLAGLLKVLLQLEHRQATPQPQFHQLNPLIELDRSRLQIPRTVIPWTKADPPYAAVSSFGFGGTNAHVILRGAEARPLSRQNARASAAGLGCLITLSASSPEALRRTAAAHAQYLADHPQLDLQQYSLSLLAQKTSGRHRLAFFDHDLPSIAARLRRVSQGDADPGVAQGVQDPSREPHIVFLFPDTPAADQHSELSPDAVAQFALATQIIQWGIEPVDLIGVGSGYDVAALIAQTLPGSSLHRAPQSLTSNPDTAILELGPGNRSALDNSFPTLTWATLIPLSIAAGANPTSVARGVAECFVRGAVVHPPNLDPLEPKDQLTLPGYPWLRARHWFAPAPHKDLRGAEFVAEICRAVDVEPQSQTAATAESFAQYVAGMALLEDTTAACIHDACRATAQEWQPGTLFDPTTLVKEGRLAARHLRLVERFAAILTQHGYLRSNPNDPNRATWEIATSPENSRPGIVARLSQLEQQFPLLRGEIALVRRCGLGLPSVLTGKTDPLTLLFPQGDASDLRALYADSVAAQIANQAIARTVCAVLTTLRSTSGRSSLRVLEIGAGTGGTTSAVLSALSAQPVLQELVAEYVFSDVSPLLVAEARRGFGDQRPPDYLDYKVIDIERPLDEQGIVPASFDLLLAANVFHATGDLQKTLLHAAGAVRPGGVLIALEGIRPQPFLDLIFGLTEGWWRFSDSALRGDYPLVPLATWKNLLAQTGFEASAPLPYPDRVAQLAEDQVVLVAVRDAAEDAAEETTEGAAEETAASSFQAIRKSPIPSSQRPSAVRSAGTAALVATADRWVDRFRRASGPGRRSSLEGYLVESLGEILGYAAGMTNLDAPVNTLGVDSLMAIQLQNRLASELGLHLPMVSFLEGKSLRGLIDEALAETPGTLRQVMDHLPQKHPSIAEGGDGAAEPPDPSTAALRAPEHVAQRSTMSLGQLALWTIYQRAPQSPAYNFVFAARAPQGLDVKALERACNQLIERHPALRTGYGWDQGEPVRIIHPSKRVSIAIHENRDLRGEELLDAIGQAADEPFDLQRGDVVRFVLWNSADGDVISIAIHHLAADLWSMDLLIRELQELYADAQQHRPSDLPPLRATFDAYVEWEHEMLRGAEGERLRRYWHEKLASAPRILDLPLTYTRPPEQTYRGQSYQWSLDLQTVAKLRAVAASQRTTLFTLLLTAYQVFLARICQQEDLLVGTVSTVRTRREWEGLVGYFLNHLVLRAQFSGNPTFRESLAQTQHDVLQSLAHQAYPFAKVVADLRPQREANIAPMVQTMFIWDKPAEFDASGSSESAHGPKPIFTPLLMEQRGAPFDLTLIVFEIGASLRLAFRYNTDLFSPQAIEQLAASLDTLIEQIAIDPERRFHDLSLLSATQCETIASWNQTLVPFDAQQSGYDWFHRWAEETPDAIALEQGTMRLSYRHTAELVEAAARRLLEHGVGPGDEVALLLPRGIEAIVSILAAWKIGAAYIPLDLDHPTARLQAILDDAHPKVILCGTDADNRHALRLTSPPLSLSLAALEQERRQSIPIDNQPHRDWASTAAYVIYTSGSSGQPKGVVVPHRGVANLAVALRERFAVQPTDRCLQFASLGFDASVFEIMMAFHAGARLCILERHLLRSTPTEMVGALRSMEISIATLPPSLLATLPGDNLPHLHTLISAGETCGLQLVRTWGKGRRMFNAYGPTETTVWATTASCDPAAGAPTLGQPIANVSLAVVDRSLQAVPIGVPGELCISGPGLAIEYRNLPVLTAQRFVPNPFASDFDATLYRTGDRARWTTNGEIEFLGRLDQQVKIDGNRIEIEEIAAQLRLCSTVREALVRVDTSRGTARIVAYLIPESIDQLPPDHDPAAPPPIDLQQVRRELAKRLPCTMIPSIFVPLADFPRTVHGKIDTAALPIPRLEREPAASCVTGHESLTPVQEELLVIYREVLRDPQIRIDDNFFEIGGASLTALQAAERATERGYRISAESIFQHQTIRELAAAIGAGNGSLVDAAPVSPIPSLANAPAAAPQSERPLPDAAIPRMVIESLGVSLPPKVLSTAEVLAGCVKPFDFPLERMTGIESRHVAGDGLYSIDLATNAALDCLHRSSVTPEQIDLLIACNISRCDGPDFEISYEPSTASKLKSRLGLTQALAFDVCNACAGFFTALLVAQAELLAGQAQRAMIVSGEYISHLTRTAQQEIESFLDPRLACLTLGDAGVAMIVQLRSEGAGFEAIEMFTQGQFHNLCVAKQTDRPHGGAIMLTDAIKASTITLQFAPQHAMEVLGQHRWNPAEIQQIIMHQTSSTTIDGAIEQLDQQFGPEIHARDKTINNLRYRGNTATTTHWVAVMDLIQAGKLHAGDQTVFAISGSGQTIGTALYRWDDLPARLASEAAPERTTLPPIELANSLRGIQIRSVAISERASQRGEQAFSSMAVVQRGAVAAQRALEAGGVTPAEIEILVHTGIYRDEYLSEPAVAAILAGALQMNLDRSASSSARPTLAFDLTDAARGTLVACSVLAAMIRQGTIERGMITAAEIENNPPSLPQRELAEIGSAILLEHGEPGYGFGEFYFRSFPAWTHALGSFTKLREGKPQLVIHRSPELEKIAIDTVVTVTGEYLAKHAAKPSDYERLLIAPLVPIPGGRTEIAARLAVDPARILLPPSDQGDLGTSALASMWNEAIGQSPPQRGDRWLLVSIGAGIEGGCVEYRHG